MTSIFKSAIKDHLNPIEDLLSNEEISEIMINNYEEIFIEKKGLLSLTNQKFPDEESLLAALRAIAQFVGKDFSLESPVLDARLPSGERIHAILPPVAKKGLTVTIRKPKKEKVSLKDLIHSGALSEIAAKFLDCCLYLSKNILISGGTGSGKTTILNILASRIPKGERLVSIEDASELMIHHPHLIMLEERKKDPYVSMNDLVRSAMRLRPDRIIIGEMRGEEALSFLQVLNTGHKGSMGTLHANNALEACLRLESLCLMGKTSIPAHILREMISSVLCLVIQAERHKNGHRRITEIAEVQGLTETGHFKVTSLFKWHQENKNKGHLKPTGAIPSFFSEFLSYELPFTEDLFKI